ncbi:riboflavin synthase [Desulfoluna sp.]|uniref:riboflavin synthase n=1 Tax=Desulfoluna sp. TaxID=2045199 RepID=UPI00262BF995|nr:riboflavin synthase [Desulfoluna sp.]
MFTGIIEGFGTIRDIRPTGQGSRFTIEADFSLDRVKLGDSIAVNGSCLTAVVLDGQRFEVDVAPETIRRTVFSSIRPGSRVNLERALRLSDRLDGHIVSGHVDGVGTIVSKERLSNAVIITIAVDKHLSRYMIEKGSVAVDGISLTINEVTDTTFTLSIIPHTADITSIGFKQPGSIVNIETDMVGKYIEKFLMTPKGDPDTKPSSIDVAFLAEKGFL